MTEPEHSIGDPQQEEHYWLPISDLMTGLMILFLFVSITYMAKVDLEGRKIKDVAVAWNVGKQKLYHSLDTAFARDLPKWNAEIDSVSLSVRFKEPDVLFASGSSEVRPRFREILKDFFPRYVAIVRAYREYVDEVRVEGHTSSEGPAQKPYYYNMELSQNRTRAVLEFCLENTDVSEVDKSWLRSSLTANGLSSSRPVRLASGAEDRDRSRRVEFRVRTNTEVRIASILQLSK